MVDQVYLRDNVREMLLNTNRWLTTFNATKYKIHVVTGDRRGAGTDANVYVVLHDMCGNKSPVIRPKTVFNNDHERASTTTIEISEDIGISPPFTSIEVWRDNFGNVPSVLGKLTEHFFGGSNQGGSAAWYLDRIEVEVTDAEEWKSYKRNLKIFNKNRNKKGSFDSLQDKSRSSSENSLCNNPHKYTFPVQRWIKANCNYQVELYDCVLPTEEPRPLTRREELTRKKKEYYYKQNIEGGPAQTAILPGDEKFSDEYYWSFAKEKLALLAKTKFIMWTTQKWKSFPALKSVLTKSLGDPECSSVWDTDEWFGLQRLQGLNPFVLKHCVEIPEKLDVTEETVSGLLGDLSLKEALEQNKLFICDLDILDGVVCKDNRKMGAPIALFYLKSPDLLLPIAIQLYQQKGPLNPVFTPKDPHNTWLVAKMYYNNCEAQHHQGVTHLGYTHLLMEGVCVCSHRNLSPSHPVFKLMAPHFLFLLAINSRGLEKLISKGGWVDGCMTQGIEGIYEVIRRGFQRHNFSSYGNVEAEIKSRGLLDPEILPYYPYRDDAISLFKIIREYVAKVINHYYDTKEKLTGDWELREWRQELSIPREKGGVGMVGVPGNDIKGFADVEELIETVAIIISTCSLGHAAANFQQYEQYGFVPNYPGILMRDPPTKKINYTESEILEILPDMKTTLDTMVITKLLSNRGTNSLGDFEMQYLYHPTDVQAADEFRKELKKLSLEVKKRNIDRRHPFLWLDPETVPNAISI